MSSLWKQKADQRHAAEEARIIAENAAWEAAEAAKTPEQKAEEARERREEQVNRAMCDATEEHARSPAFYAAQEKRWRTLSKQCAEERRIREGGHPKVDLSTGFPPLSNAAAAGAGGKK